VERSETHQMILRVVGFMESGQFPSDKERGICLN